MSSKPSARELGAGLLRAALSTDYAYMESRLDLGAPIETELKPSSKIRGGLPHHLAHRPFTRSTALSLSCLVAALWDGDSRMAAEAARCAKLLLARGACPDGAGPRTWAPLACIAFQMARTEDPGRAAHRAREDLCADLIKALAQAGADMDLRDPDDLTPLGHCLNHANGPMAQALLDAGADIEAYDWAGRSEVHRLAFHGYQEPLRLALSLGGDPDALGPRKLSALTTVLRQADKPFPGAVGCAAALIEAGCSVGPTELDRIASTAWSQTLMPLLARREAHALAEAVAKPASASPASFRI